VFVPVLKQTDAGVQQALDRFAEPVVRQ
jgi:hypothetical protein